MIQKKEYSKNSRIRETLTVAVFIERLKACNFFLVSNYILPDCYISPKQVLLQKFILFFNSIRYPAKFTFV